MKVFSFGGGVQSTAALVLAAEGRLDTRIFLFANVGDDSENPATITYLREVAEPYATAHGLQVIEVRRIRRDGSQPSILNMIQQPGSRSIPIPVRMANGAPGNRSCTEDWKIRVVARWLREHGARKEHPAEVQIGISLDEQLRARNSSGISYIHNTYPLIDLRLSRQDCQNTITRAGLPIPPKSSCWFCPFHTLPAWQRMKHDDPALFDRAVALERQINTTRARLGKDAVYLSSAARPLDRVLGTATQLPFGWQDEDEFSCGPFACIHSEKERSA